MTYSSPSRSARVRSDARSEPASGSLNPWHQRSRPLTIPGRKRDLHVGVAVLEDALHQVAEARPGWCPGGGQLLVDDDVVDARQSLAADRRRPGDAEESAVVERPVPGRLAGPVLVVGRRGREPRVVHVEPGPQSEPELGLLGRVTEVHGHPRSRGGRRTRSRLAPTPPSRSVDRRARRKYTWARHSQVLPMPPCTWMAVSHTVRAARAQ